MDLVSQSLKRPALFLIGVIFLGWLFDFLFWRQRVPGVNVTVYALVCLILGLGLLLAEGKSPSVWCLPLYPLIGFFALMSSVRMEPVSIFLCLFLTLALTAVLAVSYSGINWMRFGAIDYCVHLIQLTASFFGGGILYLLDRRSTEEMKSGWRAGLKPLWPVIRGILLALPILAVLTALLVSADLVFSQRLEDLADIFRLDRLPEYAFRFFYVSLIALFLSGLLLHAAGISRAEKIEIGRPRLPASFLGFTETAIVLGGVAALFLAFVLVQLQYFFGGEKNIGIEGFTYAEYARRGFGELIAVAVIVLVLMLVLSFAGRRESRRQHYIFAGLSAGVVGLVVLMLISAFQRLLLYEAAYGFSRLRAYTHVFMFWLGALLVLVVLLEVIQRQRAFLLMAAITSLGFAVTLNVMNVDGFIAHRNVQRAAGGEMLDIDYLKTLTTDAVPTLADEFGSQQVPPQVRDRIGVVLLHFADRQAEEAAGSWRTFHISRDRAESRLLELGPRLEVYRGAGGSGGEVCHPRASSSGPDLDFGPILD